jgi:hypothetical protein
LIRARTLVAVGVAAVLGRSPEFPKGDAKRTRLVAVVAIAVSLLGPGQVYSFMRDASPDSIVSRIGDTLSPTEEVTGTASVEVEFPPPGGWPSTSSSKGRPVPRADRTALIIGINHARGGRPLPGSVADANNLKNALRKYGFPRQNVTVLLEGKATRARILAELDHLAVRTPKNGLAVFAVATHTRVRHGTNELLTADGLRISAPELGSRLGRVRSKMWVTLPTCYAAGYDTPGITGKNRIATFATSADQPTYQLGGSGSYMFIKMVREAMLDARAPGSVEESFRYAKNSLEREAPNRVPSISDGIPGDLVLGDSVAALDQPVPVQSWQTSASVTSESSDPPAAGPARSEAPPPSSPPQRSKGNVRVCGKYSVRCHRSS